VQTQPRPTTGAHRREQDLIVIPEATTPRRWTPFVLGAAAIVAALVVGGIAGYSIGRSEADDRAAEARTALQGQAAADAQAAASLDTVRVLEARVAGLQQQIDDQRGAVRVLSASKRESRKLLDESREELAATKDQLRSVTGPAVSDGTHIGRVIAVNTSQDPARIVIFLGRWFTGDAATQAAIDDGAIAPGKHLRHGRYLSPGDGIWRIMRVDAAATVTIHRWRGPTGARTVSIQEFQHILTMSTAWAERARHDPYWFDVSNSTVTALRQQRYP
jgi:hypothetical protein